MFWIVRSFQDSLICLSSLVASGYISVLPRDRIAAIDLPAEKSQTASAQSTRNRRLWDDDRISSRKSAFYEQVTGVKVCSSFFLS